MAFEKAREEDKPIFLSIGYSACHWCHVMREESFEDPEIAALLNTSFVPVKVDREERPDIDHIYMQAALLMIGKGGWPLTVLLTPQKLPFYAGTYFPPRTRDGVPGLTEVLQRIADLWESDRPLLLSSAETIVAMLRESMTPGTPMDPTADLIVHAYQDLLRQFDSANGGFGPSPKFPPPLQCILLLRYWRRTKKEKALSMVAQTLRAMRAGGVYDQAGCGFHRYATDTAWLVPHFEKMLTDQALCALAYTEAFQATGEEEFRKTAEEVLAYVLRDLLAPDGGFFTAEDAESEGVEGKYYLWTLEEAKTALGAQAVRDALRYFTLTEGGNFHAAERGLNVLALREPFSRILDQEKARFREVRQLLRAARNQRIRPLRDEKILTDGNGLAIAALARAGMVFGSPRFTGAAEAAAAFLLRTMRRDGRLLHRFWKENAGIAATCDDYAFLIWGLVELYEATFGVRWLHAACELQRECIASLGNPGGGFFLAPRDRDDLIQNPRVIRDAATPSGNGISFQNLLFLFRLTGDAVFAEKSLALARAFAADAGESPASHCSYLIALDLALGPVSDIVVAGDPDQERTGHLIAAAREGFSPDTLVLLVPAGSAGDEVRRIAPFTVPMAAGPDAVAYSCSDHRCGLPVRTADALRAAKAETLKQERKAS
jgi:uncharacterized protein YyaL (SSP411 family)